MSQEVQHKGHNFSMCPLESISSKSTQLSCSHLPQMHMIHSWSVPVSSSKLPKHTQHLSLSISSSALLFLAFFGAGLDDETLLWYFLLAYPFPLIPCLDCSSCSLSSLVAAFWALSSDLCFISSSFCVFFTSLSSFQLCFSSSTKYFFSSLSFNAFKRSLLVNTRANPVFFGWMVEILIKSKRGEHIHLVLLFVTLPEFGVVGVGSVNRLAWIDSHTNWYWLVRKCRLRFQWIHSTRIVLNLIPLTVNARVM